MCITVSHTIVQRVCNDNKYLRERDLACINVQFECEPKTKFRIYIEGVVLYDEENRKCTYYRRGMKTWHRIYTNTPTMCFYFILPIDNDLTDITDGTRFIITTRKKYQTPKRYTFEFQKGEWLLVNKEIWTKKLK